MVGGQQRPDHRPVRYPVVEGEAMNPLSKSVVLPLLLLAVAVLALTGAHPAAAATLDTPWTGSGTGTTKVVSDGAKADPEFTYDSLGPASGAWTYSAVAGSARSVPVKWDYSGLHAWYQVRVSLERFVSRGGVDVFKESLVNAGPAVCCTTPSDGFTYAGTSTFAVQKGDVYGFRMAGSNGDANRILRGSLKLQEVDSTPPAITPVVTGAQGESGFYTGPVSVKWSVVEADSRILARSGCDDASLTQDTSGKTYTCSVTSRGGTATKSVTVKRDTEAPELTVPALVVGQASGADGATMTYAASATDNLDTDPKVACTPASGSTFPVGTTGVECVATDAAGLATKKVFDAVVYPAPQAAPAPAPAPAAKPQEIKQINAVLAFRFTITNKTTKLVGLKVKNIPARSTVSISCSGKSCPKTLKGSGTTRFSKGSSVSLAALVKGGMKSGTTITVKISSPGALTATKRLIIRKGRAPIVR
jgi:hypothetical protein